MRECRHEVTGGALLDGDSAFEAVRRGLFACGFRGAAKVCSKKIGRPFPTAKLRRPREGSSSCRAYLASWRPNLSAGHAPLTSRSSPSAASSTTMPSFVRHSVTYHCLRHSRYKHQYYHITRASGIVSCPPDSLLLFRRLTAPLRNAENPLSDVGKLRRTGLVDPQSGFTIGQQQLTRRHRWILFGRCSSRTPGRSK